MQIIGYHIDRDPHTIFTSNNETCTKPPYVEFLFSHPDAIHVCYLLDFFAANLFVLLKFNEEQLNAIYKTSELSVSGYRFKYVPKKFLSIRKDKKFLIMSDIPQYMDRWDLTGDPREKATEARKVGIQVYNALTNLGLHPKTLTSPISIFEKEVLSNLNLPTIDDMPEEVMEYSYKCCSGALIQSYQKGHFHTWDYDIASAYASVLSECIDFRYGEFRKVTEFDPTAHYGWYKGIVNMTADFHPIIYSNGEHSSTPIGTWERISLKEELEFITKHNLGTYEIEDGWCFYPNKIVKPYKEVIDKLHLLKERFSGMQRKITKRVLEGLWGATLRVDWDGNLSIAGTLFNPIFGCQTETLVKLEVARFIIENNLQDHVYR